MFGRATIRLGIGPHSSFLLFLLPLYGEMKITKYSSFPFLFAQARTRCAKYYGYSVPIITLLNVGPLRRLFICLLTG